MAGQSTGVEWIFLLELFLKYVSVFIIAIVLYKLVMPSEKERIMNE